MSLSDFISKIKPSGLVGNQEEVEESIKQLNEIEGGRQTKLSDFGQ